MPCRPVCCRPGSARTVLVSEV
ncbi:hypothetical protein SNB39_11240, partial [Escherichia coli]